MSDSKNTKNVIFPMSVLHIQLDTNVGPNGESRVELFKRTMIKMPKMDVTPIFDSEYPYFTKNVKYPKSIESADWKTKYEFFFNRRVFIDRLKSDINKNEKIFAKPITAEEEEKNEKEYNKMVQEIEKDNVMITLRCLFPIPEVFGKTLNNTYDHILTPNSNERVFKDVNVLSTFNIFGFMYKFGIIKKEKHEYFINIGGKRYMVDNVIWENDFVNHPIYKKFLLAQRNVYEEVEINEYSLRKKKDVLEDELRTLLEKNNKMQVDSTEAEIKKIEDEIKENELSLELIPEKERLLNGYLKKASSNKTAESDTKIKIEGNNLDSIKPVLTFDKSPIYLSDESAINAHNYLIKKLKEIDELFSYLNFAKKKSKKIESINSKINDINKDLKRIKSEDSDLVKNPLYKKIFEKVYKLVESFETNIAGISADVDTAEYDKFKENKTTRDKKIKEYITALKENLKQIKQPKSSSKSTSTSKTKLSEKKLSGSFKNQTTVTRNSFGNGTLTQQDQRLLSSINAIEKLLTQLEEPKIKSMLRKAEIIISIDDEIDQGDHQVRQFFETTETALYDLLRGLAIKVKGANIVYDFANEKKPMSILNDNTENEPNTPRSKRTLQSKRDISEYIRANYGTEYSLNQKLMESVKSIYEPSRITSNKDLYEVIRYFYFGEAVIKEKARTMQGVEIDTEIEEYKRVINDIYDEYISETKPQNNKTYNKYMYVGTDDINPNQSEGKETKRNAKEIYVRFDLVDADTFETTKRAPCKLYDKDLSEEFMYLVDPRNKYNRTLSRFRNLDFNSVIKDPVAEEMDPNKPNTETKNPNPVELKGGYTRRIRSANSAKTLRKFNVWS